MTSSHPPPLPGHPGWSRVVRLATGSRCFVGIGFNDTTGVISSAVITLTSLPCGDGWLDDVEMFIERTCMGFEGWDPALRLADPKLREGRRSDGFLIWDPLFTMSYPACRSFFDDHFFFYIKSIIYKHYLHMWDLLKTSPRFPSLGAWRRLRWTITISDPYDFWTETNHTMENSSIQQPHCYQIGWV